ncbi:hypothetical protein DFR86_02235 [Acidianus sulfidivorans JP7]|uniref:Uncharacterized protein n=1 Tax=Acidianus sulfidivorans JP7 TaxID=619593 RepID=A0A2U9IKH6_9CREN|nr:hypothetical protein [Acidianus sulfidivorans]AWR96485.1 hypothetical protein DFR86_02235 [Acidianus sulfidivorans JP7]
MIVYKILIITGILLLLSSILIADFILQNNSYSLTFSISSSSTLKTTINPNSKVIVFESPNAEVYGNNIVNIHNSYIELPTNTYNSLTIENNNNTNAIVTEYIFNIPSIIFFLVFPMLFIGGIIFILGILILTYKKIAARIS